MRVGSRVRSGAVGAGVCGGRERTGADARKVWADKGGIGAAGGEVLRIGAFAGATDNGGEGGRFGVLTGGAVLGETGNPLGITPVCEIPDGITPNG